jgi:hypothetical protein
VGVNIFEEEPTRFPCTCACVSRADVAFARLQQRMVKEGHDSTIRPKVQTFEFDNGKLYLDAWASDGKAHFSRRFLGWARVAHVFATTGMAIALFNSDWGHEDHCFAVARHEMLRWWTRFVELDVYDVQKAKSVKGPW